MNGNTLYMFYKGYINVRIEIGSILRLHIYMNYYTELREGGSYRCQINQTLK
jgi:hypothetical protein